MDKPLLLSTSFGGMRAALASEQPDNGPPSELSLSALDEEIANLELRLQTAKEQRLQARQTRQTRQTQQATAPPCGLPPTTYPLSSALASAEQQRQQRQQHFLLLLSDSALPLGSFAFSSGLESFLAHSRARGGSGPQQQLGPAAAAGPNAFSAFLPVSVTSYARTSLPFVLAAHDAALAVAARKGSSPSPSSFATTLARLDDMYDATIMCTVGRRASVTQGRALLSVWERAFAPALGWGAGGADNEDPLRPYALLVKRSSSGTAVSTIPAAAHAHLPPLFGAVAALVRLDRRQTADVFVLAHVKALVSAAVRASLVGPYQAQRLLASPSVQQIVGRAVATAWDAAGDGIDGVEEAAQTAPVVDLWMGRHELLYSRIFNS